MSNSYDVIAVGGGTAGVIAALQASRAGAKTLLVEKGAILGGTMTAGGIGSCQSFFAHGEQVVRGLGWELICRAQREERRDDPEPHAGARRAGISSARFNPMIYAAIADAALAEAGVDVRLHTMLASVEETDCGWSVQLCGKEGLSACSAAVLVDATGDANAAELAGCAVHRDAWMQPGTIVIRMEGYDPSELDVEAIQAAFDQAVAAGELQRSDSGWRHGEIRALLQGRSANCIHVCGVDASDSPGRTALEQEARRIVLRLLRFFRRQEGLADLRIAHTAAECGVRESARIVGRACITAADYESGRTWPDAVCYSFYPVDIHLDEGIDYRPIAKGLVPTIPLGAMLPRETDRLIAAGRCICGDQAAHSAYRVQASCMAIGQAAGAAAALAARQGKPVAEIPAAEIRALLAEHDAIVPDGA